MFQAFNLVPSLTALENVMVPLRSAGMSRHTAREKGEQLLTRVGLEDRMTHRPADLSGGQQQRVAVARAIALDPPLIVADEPTAHLDFVQVEEVLRLIRELATGDRMVVVATHDSRILPLADRVVEMVPEFAESNRPPTPTGLKAGEVLFEEGTMGDCIYVVSEGEVEIVRELAGGGEELLWVGRARGLLRRARPAVPHAAFSDRAGTHRGDCRGLFRCHVPGTPGRRRNPRPDSAPATGHRRRACYCGTRLSRTSGPMGSIPSNRQRCAWAMDNTPTSSIAVIGPPNRIGAT